MKISCGTAELLHTEHSPVATNSSIVSSLGDATACQSFQRLLQLIKAVRVHLSSQQRVLGSFAVPLRNEVYTCLCPAAWQPLLGEEDPC